MRNVTGLLLKAGQNGRLCRCGALQDSSYNWTGEAETRMKIRAQGQGIMGEKFKVLTSV